MKGLKITKDNPGPDHHPPGRPAYHYISLKDCYPIKGGDTKGRRGYFPARGGSSCPLRVETDNIMPEPWAFTEGSAVEGDYELHKWTNDTNDGKIAY